MYIRGSGQPQYVYNVYTDPNGHMRVRFCLGAETAFAVSGDLVIGGDDATLAALGKDAGYAFGEKNPLPEVRIAEG